MSSDADPAVEITSMGTAYPENPGQASSEPQKSTDGPLLTADESSIDHTVSDSVPGPQPYENQTMDAQTSDSSEEYKDTALTNSDLNLNSALPTSPINQPASVVVEIDRPLTPPVVAVQETDSETGPAGGDMEHGPVDDEFDDFDDFGETVEGTDDFDDFGDFDNAAPAAEVESDRIEDIQEPPRSPLLDFTKLSTDETRAQIDNIVSSLYPQGNSSPEGNLSPAPSTNSAFLTERSQSLWTQLCTPPPLQPPNWKLSRIRRLFLVSLGVPVDLDEILPAGTKQKKLVLPSSSHTRKSSDIGRGDGDRSTRSSSRRRKEKEAQSKLVDMPSARILCSTSDVRLRAFTVNELEEHVKRLEEVTKEASETLTYWLGKRETALGDKEAFERVIENLVEFAKKKR